MQLFQNHIKMATMCDICGESTRKIENIETSHWTFKVPFYKEGRTTPCYRYYDICQKCGEKYLDDLNKYVCDTVTPDDIARDWEKKVIKTTIKERPDKND